jgi:Family of unknown function (DUF6297)
VTAGALTDSRDRARATRAFLRSRRTRFRPTAYQIYTTLVVGAIAGALGGHAVSTLIGGSLDAHRLLVFGPVALMLVLLTALRFGTWQGPVGFSTADVSFLLTAPIAIAALVRPKLDHSLWLGAAVGAIVAGVALLLTAVGGASIGLARPFGAVAGLTAFAALAVAASWLVESSRTAPGLVRRASPVVLVAGAALLAVSATPLGRSISIWSGPWGWAVAPLAGSSGWPLAVAAILITATAATILARHRAGTAGAEVFLARAQTRSGLTASAFTLDYRTAALTYRSALPVRAIRPGRIRRPRHARRVILWRDALAMIREPARLGWATLFAAAAVVEALTHPGRPLPAGVAALALYFAASLLSEPLRIDVDTPDTGALLVSWPFARLLIAHCALPIFVLSAIAATAIVGTVAAGAAGVAALALIPTVLVPIIATAVLCAALATRRGGRVDENLLGRLLMLDASNPGGAAIAVLWLIPWLLAAVVVIGGALVIVGHGAAEHGSVIPAGTLAVGLAGAATAILARVASESSRPDR